MQRNRHHSSKELNFVPRICLWGYNGAYHICHVLFSTFNNVEKIFSK